MRSTRSLTKATVTRSADGSYSLSRPAADGSGTHQPFATLDPKTNRITLTPGPDGQFSQAAANLAASGSPDGTPIYLPGPQLPNGETQLPNGETQLPYSEA